MVERSDTSGRIVPIPIRTRLASVGWNASLLVFCILTSVLVTLLCSLAPIFHALAVRSDLVVRSSVSPSRGEVYFGGFVLVAQVCVAFVLLACAGLMINSLLRVQSQDYGVDASKILVAELVLPPDRYPAASAKHEFFSALLVEAKLVPSIYVPSLQHLWQVGPYLVVRSNAPDQLIPIVRAFVEQQDPQAVIKLMEVMGEIIDGSLAERRYYTFLISGYGAVSQLLVGIGLLGLVSYSVRQRLSEIGIRMVLGAGPSAILRLVFGRNFMLALIGIGMGIFGALGVTRYLSS